MFCFFSGEGGGRGGAYNMLCVFSSVGVWLLGVGLVPFHFWTNKWNRNWAAPELVQQQAGPKGVRFTGAKHSDCSFPTGGGVKLPYGTITRQPVNTKTLTSQMLTTHYATTNRQWTQSLRTLRLHAEHRRRVVVRNHRCLLCKTKRQNEINTYIDE